MLSGTHRRREATPGPREPGTTSEADVEALRSAGLSDAAIHDTATITAYFNFVNRTASGLGVELESSQGAEPANSPG